MRDAGFRLSRRSALIALTAALAVPSIGYAAPSFDDDKDKKGKKEDAKTDKQRSERDDRQTTGQVLEIDTLKSPPEMIIANTDGRVTVRCLKTDIIALNSVRLGDHVTVTGEKVSEILFEAQDMSVDGHLGDDPDDDDDD
ncbi:MAG: hypothetical protein IT306_03760 [Chloroflexi bacterium]|nr:hypothetical protein [Chloroflexota bacterium]